MSTPNLELPEVPEAIIESSDEINAGFELLDVIVQLTVLSRTTTTPPIAQQGQRFIVPNAGAIGAWTNRARHVAFMTPTGWKFAIPRIGWRARVIDEAMDVRYEGESWEEVVDDGGGGGSDAVRVLSGTWARPQGVGISIPVTDIPVRCPDDRTITKVCIGTLGGTGSCVVDIWKSATYPPTVADSICAAAKPTITSNTAMEDAVLTGWTVDVDADDWLIFHLDASSIFNLIYVALYAEPPP